MKKLIILIFVLTTGFIYSQKLNFVSSIEGNMYKPIGTLGERYTSTFGFAVNFGKEVSKSWAWTGKLEYFKFDKLNKDKMKTILKVAVGSGTESFNVSLSDLNMSLEIVGASANATYKALSIGNLNANLTFGFGIYRWYSPREKYTLYFDQTNKTFLRDTTGATGSYNKVLDVPSVSQSDWSGGFNLGVNLDYNFTDGFSAYAGADYKVILGELWQALALDMENAAGFQMLNFKFGVKYQF